MGEKVKSAFSRAGFTLVAGLVGVALLCPLHETQADPKKEGSGTSLLVLNSPRIISAEEKADLWVIDPKPPGLPRNWRVLERLRASRSGQFSKGQFVSILGEIRKKYRPVQFIDVDLRQESHGFLDDYAVSWYSDHNSINWGKTKSEIARAESEALHALMEHKKGITLSQFISKKTEDPETTDRVAFWRKKQVRVDPPKKVMTEQQCVSEDPQVMYVRIPVADMHSPGDREVDQFIEEMKKVGVDQWVHFHCSAGRGRTTTFLAMYDIFRNFRKFSLQEIVRRQRDAGGVDLISYSLKHSRSRNEWAAQRAQFIGEFYKYCQNEGPGGFIKSWSEWKAAQVHE